MKMIGWTNLLGQLHKEWDISYEDDLRHEGRCWRRRERPGWQGRPRGCLFVGFHILADQYWNFRRIQKFHVPNKSFLYLRLYLINGHTLLNSANVIVHITNVLGIQEDEGLWLWNHIKNQYFLDIKSTSNNILDVFNTIVVGIFQGQILPKELFIIGQLDDYRDIEHILEPFCKFEGN